MPLSLPRHTTIAAILLGLALVGPHTAGAQPAPPVGEAPPLAPLVGAPLPLNPAAAPAAVAPRVIVSETAGEPNDHILAVGEAATLTVTVEDAMGSPVPGARVALDGADFGLTGNDGRLSFNWTPTYERFFELLTTLPGGGAPLRSHLAALDSGSAVLEVLGFDREGALLPTMYVAAYVPGRGGRGSLFETGAVQVITYAGRNEVAVDSQPRAGVVYKLRLAADAAAGRRTRVIADGSNTVLLAVAVRDGGAAIPGAQVYLGSDGLGHWFSSLGHFTDAAGNLSAYTSVSGTYTVGFSSEAAFGAKGEIWVGLNGGQVALEVDETSPRVALAVENPAAGQVEYAAFQIHFSAAYSPWIWSKPGNYRAMAGNYGFVGNVNVRDASDTQWNYAFHPAPDGQNPYVTVLEAGEEFRFVISTTAATKVDRPVQLYANVPGWLRYAVGGDWFRLESVAHGKPDGSPWMTARPDLRIKNAGGKLLAEGSEWIHWTPLELGSHSLEGRYTDALGPYFDPAVPTTLSTTVEVLPAPSGAPRWPAGAALTAPASAWGSVDLQWPAAVHELPIYGYRITQNDVQIAWVPADRVSYTVTGLKPGDAHVYRVRAEGRYGNSEPLTLLYTHVVPVEPAIGVVIDNAPEARPQSGLAAATVVYEAAIAPGVTRYLAIYDPAAPVPTLGPVRSARDSLAGLAAGYGGALAHAGGSPAALTLLPQVSMLDLDELRGGGAYFQRSPDRPMPHNLYASTASLAGGVRDLGGRFREGAAPGFPAGEMSGGEPQAEVAVTFPQGGPAVAFRWDSAAQRYTRLVGGQPDRHDTGMPMTAQNVVVLHVPYSLIYRADVAEWELSADVTGFGMATFHRDGRTWTGQWSKPFPESPLTLTVAGQPMRFAAGATWVLLSEPPATAGAPTITGRVHLSGRQAPVFLGLRSTRIAATVRPSQPFALPLAGPGTYELMIYAPGYLRESFTVTVGSEPVDIGTIALTPGDYNGDGSVGSADLSWLTGLWRRSIPGALDSTAVTLPELAGTARAWGRSAPPQALPPVAPTVYLDGRSPNFDVAPVLDHGVLYVPVRSIAEVYGLDLAWDPAFRKVTLTDGQDRYEFFEGGPTLINSIRVPWPASARIVGGRTLLPMDLVASALGLSIQGGPATNVYWYGPKAAD